MSPISAKVVSVYKETRQYRVVVQIEFDKRLGPFHTLRFGKIKPFTGGYRDGRLDLFYYRDPELQEGDSFQLWTIL
jgi:hypothetical protein